MISRSLSLLLLAAVLASLNACVPVITKGDDRRTTGIYIEDGSIEDVANQRVKEKFKDTVHVNITSYNRMVLVTGEVPNEAAKADITRIVGGVQNVKDIVNELSIGPLASLSSRSGDAMVTGDVKARFMQNKERGKSDHVKVITENGTVYLLGLVTRAEAEFATEVASTTRGVQKVVRVFEYLD
jgi:osmotically-inducible protein OsmY